MGVGWRLTLFLLLNQNVFAESVRKGGMCVCVCAEFVSGNGLGDQTTIFDPTPPLDLYKESQFILI